MVVRCKQKNLQVGAGSNENNVKRKAGLRSLAPYQPLLLPL